MSEPLLSVRNLRKVFPITKGVFARRVGEVRAVHDVSFDIAEGETLSLVGESGCGKTTTGRAILRLIEPTSGEVRFGGRDVIAMNPSELRTLRRERARGAHQQGHDQPADRMSHAITPPPSTRSSSA